MGWKCIQGSLRMIVNVSGVSLASDYCFRKKMLKIFSTLLLWETWHKILRHRIMFLFSEISLPRVFNGAKLESEHRFP